MATEEIESDEDLALKIKITARLHNLSALHMKCIQVINELDAAVTKAGDHVIKAAEHYQEGDFLKAISEIEKAEKFLP